MGPHAGGRGQPGAAFPPTSAGRKVLFPGRKLSVSSCLSPTRLAPIYFSAGVLWILIAVSALGILHFFFSHYVGLNVLQLLTA